MKWLDVCHGAGAFAFNGGTCFGVMTLFFRNLFESKMSKGILIGSEKVFSISSDTLDRNTSL